MASELDSTEADGAGPRDLPAPYVSPWSELGRTLNALVADLQLRAQELLRRNREGSLLLPGFWPQDLAPIFWPLVLVLGIGAVTVLAWLGFHSWADRTPQTLPQPDQPVMAEEPLPIDPDPVVRFDDSPIEDSSSPEIDGVEPIESPVPLELEVVPVDSSPTPDPLLLNLMDARDPQSLLLAAEPDPADDLIQLRLAAQVWSTLSSMEQQRLADQWQERLSDLGYERLTLVDVDNHPLGRSALVGNGMILVNADLHPRQ